MPPLEQAYGPTLSSSFCALSVAVDLDDGGVDHGVLHAPITAFPQPGPDQRLCPGANRSDFSSRLTHVLDRQCRQEPEGEVEPSIQSAGAHSDKTSDAETGRLELLPQFLRPYEHCRVMSAGWQKLDELFPDRHHYKRRQRRPVDGVEEKQSIGTQNAPDFGQHATETLDMFKHVDANYDIEDAVGKGQALTAADEIVDFDILEFGLLPRGGKRPLRWVDAGDRRASLL